ncbi:MAG: hypothetical protein AB7L92_05400 [Alphaproteobacteria bacterium]
MTIRMLCTRTGSEDGHAVQLFRRGRIYNVADTLARYFICCGWAEEVLPETS